MEHMQNQKTLNREFFPYRFKEQVEGKSSHGEVYYDNLLQVWIDKKTNQLLVEVFEDKKCSNYGETTFTETGEGVDQKEVLNHTKYGETIITATSEGVDQRETLDQSFSSDFGETIFTKTSEGVDQTETLFYALNNN